MAIIDLRKYGGAPELGYELLAVVPYAYHLYKQGLLEATYSTKDTSVFYWFSPNHTEVEDMERGWKFVRNYKNDDFPNINIHKNQLDWEQWGNPFERRVHEGARIEFEKETIVICNRYNIEWGERPINYFSLDILKQMFELLQDKYQIVYCNLGGVPELKSYDDDAPAMDLGDYNFVQKYPKVIHIWDLFKKRNEKTINELQMKVFSGCQKFITMNGGYGIWASYMGGENIIYSQRCHELDENVNSFNMWYFKLSPKGQGHIAHVSTYEDMMVLINQKWVQCLPLINILMRTRSRKELFARAVNSIKTQTYKNVRIIAACDSINSYYYARKHPVNLLMLKPYDQHIPLGLPPHFGKPFGPNVYFNVMQKYIGRGIVAYLDDDDYYLYNDALMRIAEAYVDDFCVVTWRVLAKDGVRIIPNDYNFYEAKWPEVGDFSGLGFAYSINKWRKWEPWRRGDWRVGIFVFRDSRWNKGKIVRIDDVLVAAGDATKPF
jgi:hypothetical protein